MPASNAFQKSLRQQNVWIDRQIKDFCQKASFGKRLKPPCAAFLADYHFPAAKSAFSKADFQRKLTLAASGLLSGAERALSDGGNRVLPQTVPQKYYFELPLLITEAYPHGIGIPEILDSWKTWLNTPKLPQYAVCRMVENGIPADQAGAYQAFASYDTATAARVLGWALLNAGNPENAAKRAFTDAFMTARGDALHLAVFFVCAITMAFLLPPDKAADAAFHMLPSPLQERIAAERELSFPLLQCSFLCRAAKKGSLSEGYSLLDELTAESCCFETLGAIFGASGEEEAAVENRIIRSSTSADVLPLDDLIARMLACNPAFSKAKGVLYPWKKTK